MLLDGESSLCGAFAACAALPPLMVLPRRCRRLAHLGKLQLPPPLPLGQLLVMCMFLPLVLVVLMARYPALFVDECRPR